MKILAVADTVAKELLDLERGGPKFSDIDLLLSCGDLPPEYLAKLRHRYDVRLLYVLGNHDLRYQSSPPVGCESIDRRVVNFGNLRIAGFSGSRWYNGGVNQLKEQEMRRNLMKMRYELWRKGGVDIVLTHAPPRHIHDQEDPCHKGFKSFSKFVKKYQPAYLLHGHIHKHFDRDDERQTMCNRTRVVNCYGFYIFEVGAERVNR